ncbi:MAG: hypothetical protein ACK5S6_04215 [bacterium]|jgi:hypothetical protein
MKNKFRVVRLERTYPLTGEKWVQFYVERNVALFGEKWKLCDHTLAANDTTTVVYPPEAKTK